MNKEDFIKSYLIPKITVSFDKRCFESDKGIIIEECDVHLEMVGNYFCPWYYDIGTNNEITEPFEKTIDNQHARAIRIRDIENTIKLPNKIAQIQQYISDFSTKSGKSLCPFPVANDTWSGESLILDGNKTLAALYLSWDKYKKVPLVRITGERLDNILIDFKVVNRFL